MQFETAVAVNRAMDLFWAQGYAATTPQQLASQMGIGKGSLYNTFESKHALFVRALERYSEMRLRFLSDLFAEPGAIGPRLTQAACELTGLGDHRRGCVMVNATAELGPADIEVSRAAAQLFDGIAAIFEDAIRRGRESGEFSGRALPETAAQQLLATVIGLSVMFKSRDRSDDGLAPIEDLIETL